MLGKRVINNIMGRDKTVKKHLLRKDKWSKNISKDLRDEMNACDMCLSARRKNVIPPICQYHLNMQIEEAEYERKNKK